MIELVARSEAMREAVRLAERVAATDANVLVTGESGAGKDALALGNITGAMVFQSTIPTVVALLFASDAWHVSDDSWIAFASAAIAFLASDRVSFSTGAVYDISGGRATY